MSEHERGRIVTSAAEIYEEFFVPALFRQWAEKIAERAALARGQRVLDVACGTGVLARAAVARQGAEPTVVGLDPNPAMLAVARRMEPRVRWVEAPAEAMPFEDDGFERVLSQFGLMFFEDRVRGIREMLRVLAPGGRLIVAVWAGLDQAPGYRKMADLLERLFGPELAASLHVPYCLGDRDELAQLFRAAGARDVAVDTLAGTARFDSIREWVHTDIRGWTLADAIDDGQLAELTRAAERELAPFVRVDGQVEFPHPAHWVMVQT